MTNRIVWILIFLGSQNSSSAQSEEFLHNALRMLENIKSMSYFSEESASAPGDTVLFTKPTKTYRKVFVDPSDSLVGSSSLTFSANDTTKAIMFYNGVVQGEIYWDNQLVVIDSFQNQHAPFRLVPYPLFTKVREILEYTFTTKNTIKIDFKDYGDSVFFSLQIIDRHIYFHIKPIEIKNEYIPDHEISQFDIWFSKKDFMPYRMKSRWYHTTFFEYCTNPKINFQNPIALNAQDYYPAYFELVQFKRGRKESEINLVGTKAPEWTLKDTNQSDVKMIDLKGKVLLIQFTGIGCGPCHQSIPFLKYIQKKFEPQDFEVISIETWNNNIEGIKRYKEKNQIDFKFLQSNSNITKSYNISSVPIFFILDENRIIRNIIEGYDKNTTDSEITQLIERLLSKD